MKSLISSDFYKIKKSKLALVSFLICLGLGIFSGLLYGVISIIFKSSEMKDIPINLNFLDITSNSFSFSNNAGLIIPLFAAILILNDNSNGILRNKIIIGKNRTQIYFSYFITSLIFNIVFLVLYFVSLSLICLIFFFPKDPISSIEIINYVLCLVYGIIGIIFITSFSTFFALGIKSMPLTIVSTILIGVILSIISSVIQIGLSSLEVYEKIKYIFFFIPSFVANLIFVTNEISYIPFFIGISSYLLFTGINLLIGIKLFYKNDIK